MAEDGIYDEVFGIANGMKSAIAGFVQNFKQDFHFTVHLLQVKQYVQ